MPDPRFGKDFFSWIRLPVAREYVFPPGRRALFAVGAAAAVVVSGLFLAGAFMGGATAVAGGDLSDSHRLFAEECVSCHTPYEGVEDRKCGTCHERAGAPLGRYSWARHYLYRSQDYDRAAPASLETGCAACHAEHRGREASLQAVPDAGCVSCHEYGGFGEGHPEVAFARDGTDDDAALHFPHILHVREVMEAEGLDLVEESCLACHVAREDGRSFEPVSFEAQCDACHMGEEATPALPVASDSEPGVRTLEQIRAAGGPGALWAHYWDPNEFQALGPRVRKSPVYHRDPWIMENLRRLRRELYPGITLADLLDASATLPSATGSPRGLYDEAVATLRGRIDALGGEPSPDVQEELDRLTGLLERVEARLADPYEPLDETRFLVRQADRAPGLATGEIDAEAYAAVIEGLTDRCTECHRVLDATILRVQDDQRTMIRSEFDHRAHVLHARCLDCHTRIPVLDWAFSDEEVPDSLDRASIQNLPTIETCRGCHSEAGPSDRCTSCHLFHPDRSRDDLSRFRR